MNKLDPRNIYDDLHQIPELGFEEFKLPVTSAVPALSAKSKAQSPDL